MAGGYADATAVEAVLEGRPVTVALAAATPDAALLQAAGEAGLLATNDLVLDRRARNMGIAWLRTADLAIFAVRTGGISATEGRTAVGALRDAGRITAGLAEDYLEELR